MAHHSAVVRAEAPGRVNLIGEHTDYNGGFVLPTAIPRRTRVTLRRRSDELVRARSASVGGAGEYCLGEERPGRGWLDYLQGLTWVLRADGHAVGGFEVEIASDVPLGSGLSSSAALEVSVLRALREAFGLQLDDLRLALVGQRAESEFVGARVGVMDQLAASLGDVGTALYIDTRSLEYRRVPVPWSGQPGPGGSAELVVLHSGISHEHASGEYNARRAQCERASALLGVPRLRDLTSADLPRLASLPEPLGRRARHVVSENERVLAAVEAVEAGDLPRLGALFDASHASLRDDYEVSVPAVDLLVELARANPEVYGARLTGGGFGGAVVVLARAGTGRAVGERVLGAYADRLPARPGPALLVPPPG